MSGGHFDYVQYLIKQAANDVHAEINDNFKKDEYGYCNNFSKETLEKMKICMKTLHDAANMLERVDYLICGDDSQETFHLRWKKECLSE